MGALSTRDYQRILDLTVSILSSGEPYLPWRIISKELQAAIPNGGGMLFWTRGWHETPPDDFPLPYLRTGDDVITDPAEDSMVQHPLVRHYQTTGDRTPRVLDVLPGPDNWTDEESHHVVHAIFGDGPHFAIPLPAPPGEGHLILVHRDGDAFTQRDLELATRLEPLLAALINHQCQMLRWRAGLPEGGDLDAVAGPYQLTPRELTVLTLLGDSLTADTIARRLSISPRTVQKHVERVYRKLGTRDRVATILRAQAAGLLPRGHP